VEGFISKGDYEKAKMSYMDALNNDALCVEAIYNLGMLNKRNEQLEEALIWFEKFHAIVQDQPEVIFHIADM
jgi:intraflagellar transport protein 88